MQPVDPADRIADKEGDMGTSTQDIFGTAGGAEAATEGSYGIAPNGHRLPAEMRLGPVHLQVADLARSLAWYERVLGMRVLARGGGRAVLGAHGDDRVLVELVERAG